MKFIFACKICGKEAFKDGHSFFGGPIYSCLNMKCPNAMRRLSYRDVESVLATPERADSKSINTYAG